MTPFLSVYTPTYRRPKMLALNELSVSQQTVPVDHVIVHDTVGIGVDGMFADIPNHADKPVGQYVMVLSDDNMLLDGDFAADLELEAARADYPDVIVFKGKIDGSVQPLAWACEPVFEQIDLSCFAVTVDVWRRYADAWGHRYEGDFDFIHRLWADGLRFHWWDRLAFRALMISRGAPE